MDASSAVAAVLSEVNDHTHVHPYGDGLLIDLPLVYSDGDAVRVLVEPMGTGLRASDRGTAADLLSMNGVDITSSRPAQALSDTIHSAGLNAVDAGPGEIATFGTTDNLGEMILAVAQASMRVEQLRWLAQQQPAVTFAQRVEARVRTWAGTTRQVEPKPTIHLSSGRAKKVTAAVTGAGRTAYIQAVSDRDRSTEHCYYLFGNAERIPPDQKIAALDGSANGWPQEIVSELEHVGQVRFFADFLGLEQILDQAVPLPQPKIRT